MFESLCRACCTHVACYNMFSHGSCIHFSFLRASARSAIMSLQELLEVQVGVASGCRNSSIFVDGLESALESRTASRTIYASLMRPAVDF